ncbi:patatin-like phospholipase family protein [Dokdonella sp.]|uniref:patatin-like phospholipase family protein n=1 Tax=Dokdonella sp. TaxID=2291710 RepID=UPI001B08C3C3|nr:patatin-like phospholipase family protein [Dokdonella sp.]MBO9662844.1 patatin-like phospholipase family protein [Dokdonella sp.]
MSGNTMLRDGAMERTAGDSITWTLRVLMLSIVVWLLQACSTLPRTDALPKSEADAAAIPGIPNARYWLDSDIVPFARSAIGDIGRARTAFAQSGTTAQALPPAAILAISGGGENGAFAVGLLEGWTAHGDRPQFRVVTGVSAGALIAPFAFLGPSYDAQLHDAILSIGREKLFRSRGVFGLLSDGFADNQPAIEFVAKYMTPDVLRAVAAEYAKGRALMIGTTEMDSGRAVTWNMGAIAASGAPNALDLFRKVMVASASIPGAVSPVMIDVEANGKRYQEMHVDGGVNAQVFTYPSTMLAVMQELTGEPYRGAIQVYVILNWKVAPEWSVTPRSTLAIGGRALGMLLQRQSVADLDRIYRTAHQDGADYNLAAIGADFQYPKHKRFDPKYMNDLLGYGYRLGSAGYAWKKTPPRPDAPATKVAVLGEQGIPGMP